MRQREDETRETVPMPVRFGTADLAASVAAAAALALRFPAESEPSLPSFAAASPAAAALARDRARSITSSDVRPANTV